MAEISKITLPSGVTYDIKDTTAREAIAGGTTFYGVTETPLEDGSTTQSITVGGKTLAAVNGAIVIYGDKEFIYADTAGAWREIGDTTDLGALAYKDEATTTYKPAGTVSKPTFTGDSLTSTGKYVPTGEIVSSTDGTPNYTPAGTVTTPTITVTPNTVTKYVSTSEDGGGDVTPGVAAACTLPTLEMSVANETLTLNWEQGSFTPNTPTEVVLPSFTSQTIATGIQSATSTQPTFTGTGTQLAFQGEEKNISVTGTPTGNVSQPTFEGTSATITVS